MRRIILILLVFASAFAVAFAQEDHAEDSHGETTEQHAAEAHDEHGGHDDHGCGCHEHHDEGFVPAETAFHHIGDANAFHIGGNAYLSLPLLLYAPEKGWTFTMSHQFDDSATPMIFFGEHGTGTKAINGYVMYDGTVMHVADAKFPTGEVNIDCINHRTTQKDGEEIDTYEVVYSGECYPLDKKSTMFGSILGGGITSFYDFSITKNVFTMLLTFLVLFLMFRAAVRGYQTRDGQAPKGIQSFLEPIFTFIRDEVAIPFLGHKYERYLPFLMSIFFFILGLNLVGQIPFIPGSGNVTGNLAVTMGLALITFIVTNISGNRHYWEHIVWMPGVPAFVKLILTPVEIMGLFIKPLTLMLRLFANITGGHIVMVIFVGLIFIFGNSGENLGGGAVGTLMAVPLTMFMMALELLVALVQAFVFCILSASYIGAAIEEPHHH